MGGDMIKILVVLHALKKGPSPAGVKLLKRPNHKFALYYVTKNSHKTYSLYISVSHLTPELFL